MYDTGKTLHYAQTDNESSTLWGDRMRNPNPHVENNLLDNKICETVSDGIAAPMSKTGKTINTKQTCNNENIDQVKIRKNSHPAPLQRRYSNESLISNNSVMMHTGTLIHANAIDDLALNQQPNLNRHAMPDMSVPLQPDRPAPVLKPVVGRKPSLDRSSIFQIRKQQALAQQRKLSEKSDCNKVLPRPTYEDTLKKCQSLTRHHSSPPSPNPSMNNSRQDTIEKVNATRQMSCPTTSMSTPSSPGTKYTPPQSNFMNIGASPILNKRLAEPPKSPAVPPKPDLTSIRLGYTNRQNNEDGNSKKLDAVKHLPPSGNQPHVLQKTVEHIQSKPNMSLVSNNSGTLGPSHLPMSSVHSSVMAPLNNRQHQLNQAFINDLHLAMSAKLAASQDSKKNVVENAALSSIGSHHHQQKTVNASVNNWLMNQTSMNNPTGIEYESPPFPVNRFSNGEYDNIQNNNSISNTSSAMNQNIKTNRLIKPSGVAKAVKLLPGTNANKSDISGPELSSRRPPNASSTQRVKKMAPPPPPLAKRTKENEKVYSNWKRS